MRSRSLGSWPISEASGLRRPATGEALRLRVASRLGLKPSNKPCNKIGKFSLI